MLEPHRHGTVWVCSPYLGQFCYQGSGRQDGETDLRGFRGPFLVRPRQESLPEGRPHARLLVGPPPFPPWGWDGYTGSQQSY